MKHKRCCGTCGSYKMKSYDDQGQEWGHCEELNHYLVGYTHGEFCTLYKGPADESRAERQITRLRSKHGV